MIKEFKEFISRGNMMDLAVGVIIGAAFTAIVNSLVKDLINPLIGLFIGKIDLSNLKFTVGEATFKYGSFLNAVINFLIIALVVFFLIKLVNKMMPKKEVEEDDPTPTNEELYLRQIRDLLQFSMNRKELEKRVDEADITADPIFSWVMEQGNNCRDLLRAIAPELHIQTASFETQKRLKFHPAMHGIIPDIYATDNKGRVFDIELQMTLPDFLGKRMRYYFSMMDQSLFMQGENYRNLPTTYLILILPTDPLGLNQYRYDTTWSTKGFKHDPLNIGQKLILLNASGTKGKITPRLQGFFDLMRGKINTNDSFVQKLQSDVEKYKTNPERRKELMDYQMKLDDMRYVGEKAGIKTGKEEERINAIKKMIRRYRQFNADDKKILSLLTQDYGNDFSQKELRQFIKNN